MPTFLGVDVGDLEEPAQAGTEQQSATFLGVPISVLNNREAEAADIDVDPRMQAARARNLDLTGARDEGAPTEAIQRSIKRIPFIGSGFQLGSTIFYNNARGRIRAGQPDRGDYDIVANYEARQRDLQERMSSTGGFLAETAMNLPRMAGEALLAGRALPAVTPAPTFIGRVAQTATHPGRLAAQTAFMPSMYLEQGAQRNMAENRDPLDLRGMAAGFGLGMVNVAALESIGGFGNNAQTALGGYAARAAGGTAIAAQASHIASGAVGEALAALFREQRTGFGPLEDAFRGRWGEAGKHLLGDALTFSAFAFMHGRQPEAERIPQAVAQALAERGRQGESREAALRYLLQETQPVVESLRQDPTGQAAREVAETPLARAFADAIPPAAPEPPRTAPAAPEAQRPGEGHRDRQGRMTGREMLERMAEQPAQVQEPQRPATEPSSPQARLEPLDAADPQQLLALRRLAHKYIETYKPLTDDHILGVANRLGLSGHDPAEVIAYMRAIEAQAQESIRVAKLPEKGSTIRIGDREYSALGPSFDAETGALELRVLVGPKWNHATLERWSGPGVIIEPPFRAPGGTAEPVPEPKEPQRPATYEPVGEEVAPETQQPPPVPEPVAAPVKPPSAIEGMRARQRELGRAQTPERPTIEPRPERTFEESVPALQEAGRAAGLNARQIHVLSEVAKKVPFSEMTQHPEMKKHGLAQTEQNMNALHKKAEAILARQSPEVQQRVRNELLTIAEDHARAEAVRTVEAAQRLSRQAAQTAQGELSAAKEGRLTQRIDEQLLPAQRDFERITAELLREAAHGNLTPEQRASIESEAASVRQALREAETTSRGQVSSEQGTPAEAGPAPVEAPATARSRKAAGRAVPAEYVEIAREEGISLNDLRDAAAAVRAEDRAAVTQNADIRARAAKAGITSQALTGKERTGGDVQDIRGFDTAAQSIIEGAGQRGAWMESGAGEAVGQFASTIRPGEYAADALARILSAGPRARLSENRIHQLAIDRIIGQSSGGGSGPTGSAAADVVPFRSQQPGPRPGQKLGAERPGPMPGEAGGFGAAGVGPQTPAPNPLAEGARIVTKAQVDSGAIPPAAANSFQEHLQGAYKRTVDYLGQLGGQMFPQISRVHQPAGEALAREISVRPFVREATPYYIDITVGGAASQAERVLVGTTFQEMRHRAARHAHLAEAAKKEDAALRIMRTDANAITEKTRLLDESRAHREAATDIVTFIGQEGSPLRTEQEFQDASRAPWMRDFLNRWQSEFVPEMNRTYRESQGLAGDEAINSLTQIPGFPMNAKPIFSEAEVTPTTVFIGGRGNLKNLRTPRNLFAQEATLAGKAYDTDIGAIIENSLTIGARASTRANTLRELVEGGIGQFSGEKRVEGFREIPDVRPPKGTDVPEGSRFFIKDEFYKDILRAWDIIPAAKMPAPIRAFTWLMNKAALSSTAEAVYHAKNLLTMMTRPGMNPLNLIRNLSSVIKGDPEASRRIVELARIGAMKEHGFETTEPWGGKYNPLTWMSKGLTVLDRSMRLTAEDAFNRLQRSGMRIEETETSKRDFINQLGQYNRKAQNEWIALARDSGFGPFATAGSNFYMNGWRSLVGGHGLRTLDAKTDLALRANVMARQLGVLGTVAFLNYMVWKNVFGDDQTPFGALKVGTRPNGTTAYYDFTNLTGLTRGMRNSGLLALIEGNRRGESAARITDRAARNVGWAPLHPLLGPPASFAEVALTGERTGFRVAPHVPRGQSQAVANMRAALINSNPLLANLSGEDSPYRKSDWVEKAMKVFGPFGVQFRGPPKTGRR